MDPHILNNSNKSTIRMKNRAKTDLVFGLLVIVFMVFLSVMLEIDLVESLYEFTRIHENWEMDEYIISFLWVAVVATIYGIRRVLDIKEINKEIIYQAYYDSLTGLPNRDLAQFHLEKSLQRAHRKSSTVCVIFIDLVNFKDINDSYGHDVGDMLIKQVGKRLTAIVRVDEMVARLGGDEFLIIAEFQHESPNIQVLLSRIEHSQNEPLVIDNRNITSHYSIGVALSPQHGDSVKSLLVAADSAMYESKRSKLQTACYYTDEIGRKITERYRLSSQLKCAIKNELLYLVYQPIICASSGNIKGYEVLTRWNLEGTHINPEVIISLAEDIGESEGFFKWLLSSTLKECDNFLKPEQFIAINVSVRQFSDVNFIKNTQCITAQYGEHNIEFEITESSIIADFEETISRIDTLNGFGIKVMIDDFGTGYSSLSRLKQLNVSKLKIDREFLNEATNDLKSAGIYESIVELAHKLNIDIVAEGVETKEQLHYLQQFHPIYMQGYLFQKPQIMSEQTSALIIQQLVLGHEC